MASRFMVGALLCAASIAWAQQPASAPGPGVRKAVEQLHASLKAAFRATLRDPESARWGPSFVSMPDTGDTPMALCGQVNAKNGYGGYTGMSAFIATTDGAIWHEEAERPAAWAAIWATWCSRPVLPQGKGR